MSTSRLRLQKTKAEATSSPLQDLPQRRALFLGGAGHLQERLAHRLGRGGWRVDGNLLGVHQELGGQTANLRRHGGREKEGLADLGQQPDDALHIGHEAHIQHAVRLVDHQDLNVHQEDLAALEKIEQASRRGDQDLHAAVQLLLLLGQGGAAGQERHGELVVLAVELEVLGHLGRQLARRRDDQGAWHARLGSRRRQDLDHRQGEGCGLTCPGLRAAEYVSAGQNVGNRFGLNRRRGHVAHFVYRFQDLGTQSKISEVH